MDDHCPQCQGYRQEEPLKAVQKLSGGLQSCVTMTHFGPTDCAAVFRRVDRPVTKCRHQGKLLLTNSNAGRRAMSKQAEFAVILKMNPMFKTSGRRTLRSQALPPSSSVRDVFQATPACLYGVRRGRSGDRRLRRQPPDVEFVGPGDLFSEVAVLDGESRSADAAAGSQLNCSCCGARFPVASGRRQGRDQADQAVV